MIAYLPIILTAGRDDEIYGIIGRALAFATSFELNCKALQAIMGMKKLVPHRGDKQAITDFCEKLEKQRLFTRIKLINEELKDTARAVADHDKDRAYVLEYANKLLEVKLKEARKARNEIAHDLGKGIEHFVEDDEWREKLIKEVETLVRKIAEADVSVYNLCQYLTNEPTFKGDYCEAAVNWVCEECEE